MRILFLLPWSRVLRDMRDFSWQRWQAGSPPCILTTFNLVRISQQKRRFSLHLCPEHFSCKLFPPPPATADKSETRTMLLGSTEIKNSAQISRLRERERKRERGRGCVCVCVQLPPLSLSPSSPTHPSEGRTLWTVNQWASQQLKDVAKSCSHIQLWTCALHTRTQNALALTKREVCRLCGPKGFFVDFFLFCFPPLNGNDTRYLLLT